MLSEARNEMGDLVARVQSSCTEEPSTDPNSNDTGPPLSEEIWTRIFENLEVLNLCQIRLVCSQWKKIVDDEPSLRQKFTLKFTKCLITRNMDTNSMIPAGTIRLGSMTIAKIGSWWSPRITDNLINLEFKGCKTTLFNIMEMLKHTPNLISLHLDSGTNLAFTKSLEKISIPRLEKLETLKVCHVKDDRVLELFGDMFPQLNYFGLSSQNRDCEQGLFEMIRTAHCLEGISIVEPKLVHFLPELADMRHEWKQVSLVLTPFSGHWNKQLIYFSQNQPLLERFNLTFSKSVKTSHRIAADKHVFGDYDLNKETFIEITRNLSRLKHLTIGVTHDSGTHCEDFDLQALSYLPELKHFSFHGFKRINFSQILSFTGARNPNLTELHLTRITYPTDTTRFALQEYIENAPNLRVITLESCSLTSWSDVFATVTIKNSIEHLNLSHVTVRDNFINCFYKWECLEKLKYLEITATSLPMEILKVLFRICTRVEELYLSEMENINDDSMPIIFQHMTKLRKLSIHECPITHESTNYIIVHRGNLEQLAIKSCHALTKRNKAKLKEAKILKVQIDHTVHIST